MLKPLTDHEKERFGEELAAFLESLNFSADDAAEGEVAFTRSIVLPRFRTWVTELRRRGLFVRGDGGPSTLPIQFRGLELYPDVEICIGTTIECAVEVKFLKDGDPTGALTKAVGQASLYSHLRSCFGCTLIIDLRHVSLNSTMQMSDRLDMSPQVSAWIFSPQV